ncbi:elongin C [Sugiyamaella lignohabitans]|uniref:Elongin-C n=1 Tax=Sugiyamaella lignohabitans TaxID=796027 RepID=A0A167FJ45_9ASCO|nr:elongin C [Sugiyamaella lignohabitans]ANB15368.1 elongin C [Sugiyamaella lignohabitans]
MEEILEPEQSEFVTLISSDGFRFVLPRKAAMISGTLNGMLSASAFTEAQYGRVHLGNISGELLEKICEYLCFNLKYKDRANVPEFEIAPEMALELLVAADFLDSKYLEFCVSLIPVFGSLI